MRAVRLRSAMRRRLAAALSLEYAQILDAFVADAGTPAAGSFEWRQARRRAEEELVMRHPHAANTIAGRL